MSVSLHELVVGALAVSRVSRLVVDDEVTRPVRERAWGVHPKLGYLLSCPYCVAVWAGLAVAYGVVPKKLALALALSEVVPLGYSARDLVTAATAREA